MDLRVETEIRDGLADMAEIDLDYPFQAFRAALDNSGMSDELREPIYSALIAQIRQFKANQIEWSKKVYNA